MTIEKCVKSIFGNISDEKISDIVWSCTGYPGFFTTNNHVKEFYYQLKHAKRALDKGFTYEDIYFGKDKIIRGF